MKRRFKTLIFMLALIAAICTLTGCEDSGSSSDTDATGNSGVKMSAFGLKAIVNDSLDEDATGTIWETTIKVAVPYDTKLTKLRASFEHNGSSVTVNGTEQISGATTHDFTNPIKYVVHGSDDTLTTYTVTMVESDGLKVENIAPEDDSQEMSIYSSIEVKFSEAILDDSLDDDSVTLTCGSTRVYGTTINVLATNSLVFIPYKLLEENVDYTVTISGKLVSTNLLGLDTDIIFAFSTGSYQPKTVGDIRVFSNFESGYIRKDLDVTFTTTESNAEIQAGWSKDLSASEPNEWTTGNVFDFDTVDTYGTVRIFARAVQSGIPIGDNYAFTYKLVNVFPPASEDGECEGIDGSDDIFVAWATAVDKTYGGGVSEQWRTGSYVMGNGGVFIYTFDSPISDGKGPDFAVGENAFRNDSSKLIFAELYYVEISSNGTDYLRFDNVSLTTDTAAYLAIDPGKVYGLGSVQIAYYGYNYRQPYDLAWLRNKKEVLNGTVDLSAITHVKYTDIPGTDVEDTREIDNDSDGIIDETYTFYPQYDSFGHIIRDAYLTWGSGGADVYKPGVIHLAE